MRFLTIYIKYKMSRMCIICLQPARDGKHTDTDRASEARKWNETDDDEYEREGDRERERERERGG